jgi:hypothetical protein
MDELIGAFVKLVDDTFFEYLHLVPWEDISWITEETEMLPLIVPVIAQVIISSNGKMEATKITGIMKSLAYLIQHSRYDLGDDKEEIELLLEHVRSEADDELSLKERLETVKSQVLKALKEGCQRPIAEVYPRLSDLIAANIDDEDEGELFIYLASLILPLLRRTLAKGDKKPIAFESYVFLAILKQLKGYHIPNDMWNFLVLLFRFLQRNVDLGLERSLLCHQTFLTLAESRITASDPEFQKLFVGLRLNIVCRGLACHLKRCVKCFDTIASPIICDGCHEVSYCNANCQKIDAKTHERECGKRGVKDQFASEMAREVPKEFAAPETLELEAAAMSLKRFDDLEWNKIVGELK